MPPSAYQAIVSGSPPRRRMVSSAIARERGRLDGARDVGLAAGLGLGPDPVGRHRAGDLGGVLLDAAAGEGPYTRVVEVAVGAAACGGAVVGAGCRAVGVALDDVAGGDGDGPVAQGVDGGAEGVDGCSLATGGDADGDGLALDALDLEAEGLELASPLGGGDVHGDRLALGVRDLRLEGLQVGDCTCGGGVHVDGLAVGAGKLLGEEVELAACTCGRGGDLVFAGAGDQLDLVADRFQLALCFLAQDVDLDGHLVRVEAYSA